MADNITLNPGTGGVSLATDEIAGAHYQRCKIVIGANSVNDGDVSSANPLPVVASPGDAEAVISSTPLVRTAVFNASDTQITNFGGPATSGGCSEGHVADVDETEDEIKASGGQVYSIQATNMSTGVRYLKIYGAPASSVTVGTTAPVATITLPTAGDSNGVTVIRTFPHGLACASGICVAATTGFADNDTGAPGASDVNCSVVYK